MLVRAVPIAPQKPPGLETTRPLSLDRVAGWLSAACAVHCLALPVASALVPLVGTSASGLGPGTDAVLTLLVALAAGAGAWLGFLRHRNPWLASAMIFALALHLGGHALEGSWLGHGLGVTGALALAAASFASARASHQCAAHLAER